MANERRNDRVRLLGNWCNAGSIAIITLGTLAPTLAALYQWFNTTPPNAPILGNWQLPALSLLVGVLVHFVGQLVLHGIIDQKVTHGSQ